MLLVALALIAVVAGRRPPLHRAPVALTEPPASAAPLETPAAPVETPAQTPAQSPTPAAARSGAPRLAIIIDDCGQWPATERGFIALPIAITLSVLPDVPFNHAIEREAAAAGKGVMLHLPMETVSGLNPGPGKVTTEMDDAAIAVQVQRDLDDVDLATGVNNHEGSKATADARVMNAVAGVLARDGRFFIDSKTSGKSVAETIAAQHGVRVAGRDVFLDNRADVAYTEGQLRAAVALAKRNGSAIAIGHPRPTTLAAVRAMVPEIRADGVEFVLVRDLVQEETTRP
ncbi:MAG: divergent polysaccharide deacetylase family protein [Candidatus Velthaea sp.]|jgi:hypothetical protein